MSKAPAEMARLSLLGSIKEISKSAGRLDATIVTTFAFNGPFYEDVMLRAFERAGSRLNIVLVDARQLAESLVDEMRRPRRAGRDYVLCPVDHARAFHPKLLVLLSEKHRGLAVGSHNLTAAGFGHNEEVSTFWDIRDDAPAALVEPAVEYCLDWLKRAGTLPDDAFKDVARRLRSLGRSADADAEPLECALVLDSAGPLWETLERAITGPVRRAMVLGPYFDQDFGFLRRVSESLSPKDFIVGIEPETVLFGDLARAPASARFVDLATITTAPKRRGEVRFSHAKVIAIETEKGWVVSIGSANPTGAGWGIGAGANAEANVVLTGGRAVEAVARLGLLRLVNARVINKAELIAVAARSAKQRQLEKAEAKDAKLPLLLQGRLTDGAIIIEGTSEMADVSAAELWTSAGEPWSKACTITPTDNSVEFSSDERFDGGLYSLRQSGDVIAFVLVHDGVSLRASSTSREATQLLSSLGRIDQYEGFDEIFDLITRHVVDAEPRARAAPGSSIAQKIGEAVDEDVAEAPYGPRGVSLADDRTSKARARLLEHGLVSDLISTLIASLYTASAPPPPNIDGDAPDIDAEDADGDEESGENLALNVEGTTLIKDVDWPLVVKTCRHRTSVLINRLKKKLEKVEPDPAWELGKILSVLCLVQKLRTIPPPSDMVLASAPDSLVRGDQLEDLYAFAVTHTYGPGKLSERLAQAGGANGHERLLLDNQLLWYARELGVDCGYEVSTAEDRETRDEVLQDRANLIVIAFSAAAGESELWLKERSNALSRWSDSVPVLRDWYARHRFMGERLQVILREGAVAKTEAVPVKDGGYVVWKAQPRLPRVVRSIGADKATLFEPGGGVERKIMLSGLEGVDFR